VTDSRGAYFFAAIPGSFVPGMLSMEPIAGYDFIFPVGGTASVPLDGDQVIDFEMACVYVTVSVTVESDCLGLMENMPVDLIDAGGGFHTGHTDAAGQIFFQGIRGSDEGGEVTIALPEGFAPVSPPDGHILVDLVGEPELTFVLACLTPVQAARGMGYWKHQAKSIESGNGNAQESAEDMRVNFPQAIFNRFYSNELNSIDVENVTFRVEGADHVPMDLETILATLSVKGNSGMLSRAKQHYLALLLNVASHKLESHSIASEDGKTVSHAIQYIAAMIKRGEDGDYEQAKDVAEALNEGLLVPVGAIPDDLPFVPFIMNPGDKAPSVFAMSQNFPNPFNPSTTIKLALPEAVDYELTVVDASGRLVRDLSGSGGPGTVTVIWDGCDRNGSRVSSGVYFYEAHACGESIRMKMQLVK
jgi:hypothetical protein